MSKTHRRDNTDAVKRPKPRQVKRDRQRAAMQPQPQEYPQRVEPVTFKPMW